jgi:AmiR/NasT family two-component response regulator
MTSFEEQPGHEAAVKQEERMLADDVRPVRVVIAEDEAIIRLDLKEILVSAGYEVVGETGRGDEAVALVDERRPDLAILDIKMPGMDGLHAAKEITARHRVAVLVLTAFSQRDLIEGAREAGVAAYLVKPFRREELLPAVADVLGRCREDWAIDEDVAQGAGPGRGEGDVAEDKIATRQVVEEAKSVLMDRHGMAEPDAFGFIQRTAMQTRSRMRDVARRVVEGGLNP